MLEGLLDDDEDMESMYLSRKERQREAKEAATAAEQEEDGEAEDAFSDGETIPEEDEEEEEEEDDTDDKMSSTLPSRFEQRKSMTQPIETPFSQNGVQKTGLASMISLSLNLYYEFKAATKQPLSSLCDLPSEWAFTESSCNLISPSPTNACPPLLTLETQCVICHWNGARRGSL